MMATCRIFSAEDAGALALEAQALPWMDGASTAGWHARLVKNNRQAAPGAALERIQQRILEALQADATVISACMPLRLSPPLLSRYEPGMAYGDHVDDAVRPGDPPMRADLSFTLFLVEPDTYSGGDLVIGSGAVATSVRLPAGCAVFYPSDTLHRVEQVTGGVRLAAVGWMQSLVRSAQQREILHDLDLARRHVFESAGKGPLFDTLAKTHANLLRLWAEI
ncbi:MAG: Fe2+-dependent dioxygenase [Mesorhizobium amorphae]|nr:MAG: Fe2+-dependent dioxygenase [Mesorhizobium amorphae]